MTTETITTSGYWTCPAYVSSATVECWGGGAGGGTAIGATAAGGGGGGAYSSKAVTVVPGQKYRVTIGAFGTTGVAGGDTSFFLETAATEVMAKGGGAPSGATGGTGGASGSGVGTTKRSGGNGANGVSTTGGGGGGSATNPANGNNGSGATGGTGEATGGTGGANNIDGTVGADPGAGGGGGGGGDHAGGSGGLGRVKITYTAATVDVDDKDLMLRELGALCDSLPHNDLIATKGSNDIFDSNISSGKILVASLAGLGGKVRAANADQAIKLIGLMRSLISEVVTTVP